MKKAWENVSFLCEAIGKKTMEIDLLWMQLDQEVIEKLELCGKVQKLEVSFHNMSMRPKTKGGGGGHK